MEPKVLRTEPRISVNKLAEYIVTTGPLRRQRIIRDQIVPPTFQVARYEDARRIMARYLTNPARTVRDLLSAASGLRDKAAALPINDDRRKWALESARAVEAFAPLADRLRKRNLLAVRSRRSEYISIGGVRVSIFPDVSFIERGTERRVGALKYHCSITRPLNAEGLQVVATVLHAHLAAQGDDPTRTACIAVDVFTPAYESAPRGMKNRMKNIEAACYEIATTWPRLLEEIRTVNQPG